jgi:hypothetical protein
MPAFDTAITPVASTPANTSNATLFTAAADTSVLVDAANILTAAATIRVGVTPSGGAVHWKVFDLSIPPGNGLLSIGPIFLQTGDAVTVQTGTANSITFSLTGVETS